jgi:hypothetical protein
MCFSVKTNVDCKLYYLHYLLFCALLAFKYVNLWL